MTLWEKRSRQRCVSAFNFVRQFFIPPVALSHLFKFEAVNIFVKIEKYLFLVYDVISFVSFQTT